MNNEFHNLSEEALKIFYEEGDLLDTLDEIEYDDYETTGDFDYD